MGRKILLIVLIVAILFSLNKFWGEKIRNGFYLIFSPLTKGLFGVGEGVSQWLETLLEIKTLNQANQELFARNLRLAQEIANLKEIARENQALREALNLELQKEFELSLTEIVSEPPDRDLILISGGKRQGISEGMPVITKEKVLLGRIEKALEDFSEVKLISAKNFVFDVEIQGQERALGVAEGKGNSQIEFRLVPQEKQIEKGDVVVTSNLGGNFPKGLLVGEILEVQKSEVGPFQRGKINPYFTQQPLKFLFVIRNFEPLK